MDIKSFAAKIVKDFGARLGQIEPGWEIKNRPDGPFLMLYFAEPNDRLYEILNSVLEGVGQDNPFFERVAIVKRERRPANVVGLPEARMLQKELSESLTVDRNTFGDNFSSRYIPSVSNYEQVITGNANFAVYGRRGSGKSSLLAYAMHYMEGRGCPFSWVALQAYRGRTDDNGIASVLSEIYFELAGYSDERAAFETLAQQFEAIAEGVDKRILSKVDKSIPRARRMLGGIARRDRPVTIFLDDIHVMGDILQPKLLSVIYALTRGNNCYIKVSGIEQFTNLWDGRSRLGLESPHDAQILKLDHNLTTPDLSERHIINILHAHAKYCGLPGIDYLAENEVLARLVLVAAAVPRDSLSLFSQAITKASVKGQKAVTITAINAAASETVEEKLRDIAKDAGGVAVGEVRVMLDRIRDFCVKKKHLNSFLAKIDNANKEYGLIQKLIALRFVHVLHEGITPHKVAERYVALMLDFGFYIGVRAARSVKLFPDYPRPLAAKELRKLPILDVAK